MHFLCTLWPAFFPTPSIHSLATARGLTLNLVHGTLGGAALVIVVVCGSVSCALAVKVHRLRKYTMPNLHNAPVPSFMSTN